MSQCQATKSVALVYQPVLDSPLALLASLSPIPGIHILRYICHPILSRHKTQELPLPHERLKVGLRICRGTPCSKISKVVLVPQVGANSVEESGEGVLEVMGFTKATETFMHCKVQKCYFIIRNKTPLSY